MTVPVAIFTHVPVVARTARSPCWAVSASRTRTSSPGHPHRGRARWVASGRMRSRDLLLYAYDQIQETLRRALGGLTAEQLTARVAPEANTIAWLAWHLVRVQDDHVAEVAGREQVWTAEGWAQRFGLPFDDDATGYSFSPEQAAAVPVESPQLPLAYAAAVGEASQEFLQGLSGGALDRVGDRRWDPPVTLGVRLVSVLSDDLQHIGQAAYLRGLLTAG